MEEFLRCIAGNSELRSSQAFVSFLMPDDAFGSFTENESEVVSRFGGGGGGAVSMGVFWEGFTGMKRCVWGGRGGAVSMGVGMKRCVCGGRGGAVSMGVFLEGFMGMKRCVWGGGVEL